MSPIWSGVIGALIAFAGVVIGTLVKGKLDRHAAKLSPKTTGRAEAYRDFVKYVLANPDLSSANAGVDPNLKDVVARLIVFGDKEVLAAMDDFLLRHRTLQSGEGCAAFARVVTAMRASLVTNSGEHVEKLSERIIRLCAGIPQSSDSLSAPSSVAS